MTQPVNKALAIRAHSEPEPHKQPELNTEPHKQRGTTEWQSPAKLEWQTVLENEQKSDTEQESSISRPWDRQ